MQIQDRSVKGPADLFILKSALQPAEDGGVVAADIEDLVRSAANTESNPIRPS